MRDANGQALAYVESRATETDAMQAKALTGRRSAPRHRQYRTVAGIARAQSMKA
jgi:hypothetical protein